MFKTSTRKPPGRVLGLFATLGLIAAPAAADETYVLDRDTGTGNAAVLFRVDAASGARTLVSDFGNLAQGPLGDEPNGLAVEAAGTVLVCDFNAGTGRNGALFRVDRLSGRRTSVSDFGSAAQGAVGFNPYDVAVVVPACQGRVPTVVGDDGNNVLIASPGNDVITGRGGADLIDGRGGNDLICGGDGNDALRGSAGNDGVEGGAGNDTLEGGPGDDRLDGGTGTDLVAGGTNTDRCQNAEVKLGCEL
ncbi:MAG: calcium-binding protein [Actinomycetes bacterium]